MENKNVFIYIYFIFEIRRPFSRHPLFGFEDDDMMDIKTYLCNANISMLREMQGGQILLDLCTSLPNISKFMTLRGMTGGKPSLKMIDNLSLENMLTFRINRWVARFISSSKIVDYRA